MRATFDITPYERDLIFRVVDDVPETLMPIYLIRRTCQLSKEADFIQIMRWLHKNRIVGRVFLNWFESQEGVVNTVAQIRKHILRDFEARKVFAKDHV